MGESRMIALLFPGAGTASLQRFPAFPYHERRNPDVNNDRDDANHEIDVTGTFQGLDHLRADFSPHNGSAGHDKPKLEVDVAEGAMRPRRHDRFSDDVGEICSHREVPRQTTRAQSRPGNKAAAHAEKTAQNSDDKADRDQIGRANVRVRDGEIHALTPIARE